MSSFPFISNLIGVKANDVTKMAVEALVRWDPTASSQAELLTMEQNLDVLGKQIAAARDTYDKERKELDAIDNLSHQRMSAADLLQKQMDAESDPGKKAALQASLEKLVAMLEEMAPDLEQEKKDVQDAQNFMQSLEQTYNEAAKKLKGAQTELARASRDMSRAAQERQVAQQRAEQARQAAGLANSTNSLNVALQAMRESASKDRQAADAAQRKATVLAPSAPEKDDANIARAMAAAAGKAPTSASLTERLAALKAKQ